MGRREKTGSVPACGFTGWGEHSEGVKKEEPVSFGGVRPGQEPPEGFSGGFRAEGPHVSLGRHQSLQNCLLLALGWGMK